MTAEHLLQACPLHDTLRCQFCPVETEAVTRKLFGSLEDLRRTAAFEQGTGVSVGVFDKKTRASPGYMLS